MPISTMHLNIMLSYCWRDPLVTVPIQVDGRVEHITTNLEAVLRELRARRIKTVWVDALCINQQDLVESGLQVMRMLLIYSRAVEVLAWLGPEAKGSARAMERLLDSNVSFPRISNHQPIRDLFERPYWKRVCKSIQLGRVFRGD